MYLGWGMVNEAEAAGWLFGLSQDMWHVIVRFIIAGTAFWVAVWAYLGHKNNAARRATIDLVEKTESSEYYRKLQATFRKYRISEDFSKLHVPGGTLSEDRQDVLAYMNHYELVAIGVLNGILDPKMYREWMGSAFVRDWLAVKDFVQRERWKKSPEEKKKNGKEEDDFDYFAGLFRNFNLLAYVWDENDLVEVLAKKHNLKPKHAEGPGDETMPPVSCDPRPWKIYRMKHGNFLGTGFKIMDHLLKKSNLERIPKYRR